MKSLIHYCEKNSLNKVKELINNEEDINIRNQDGDTALIIVCKKGF